MHVSEQFRVTNQSVIISFAFGGGPTVYVYICLFLQSELEDREERKKREKLREDQRKREDARAANIEAAKVGQGSQQ